jgi:hypothetical protein
VPISRSAASTVVPAGSVVVRAVRAGSFPVNTALPIMLGLNREPSSLNQLTTATLYWGAESEAAHRATARCAAWAEARTPYAPS